MVTPSATLGVEKYRDQSRRDFARLIHCPSFRRLQGKTQLFPSHESDFFRNRLTHSLEVAQIAKSIAIRINSTDPFFKRNPINLDMVEFAGLAHDLGHPPFGHNGEATLDRLMLRHGGFEGNAQTLRLIARIEKKTTTEFPSASRSPRAVDPVSLTDLRLGLNLTYRSLASILKYDRIIPQTEAARVSQGSEKKPVKGYYASEGKLVERIKAHVAPEFGDKFRTIECHIMDVADDIAYSTYDLEDAFKANFLTPLAMMAKDDEFKEKIAAKVRESLSTKLPGVSASFAVSDVNDILGEIFKPLLQFNDATLKKLNEGATEAELSFLIGTHTSAGSQALAEKGYLRTSFTSDLVGRFIRGVQVIPDSSCPSMSAVHLDVDTFKSVETLKHFAFELLIVSPMLKIAEKRGDQIIKTLFECFMGDRSLLPSDWRELYGTIDSEAWQARVVCDYISGMSDRYCVEMYARITSENPITIWKPH
ncbi:deoxyguanosinetriphosphate triphosphohydrolase [Mesorhizobium ciceri biovar biserrulae WSM1271]|uniref:Deoxyguanosinetriphosphate triphosphohydrolase n=1 Tax=Mesorhizobium ciceri biovar biserrulae (strain HAMBI 2942 / LMG 23838 / WSM1271) TaxID=765698 RepID=E8T7U3_MESCW|nr:deoxyguanosinetriphosphate triphosphohydrolase [Mesorhizobium ciceri biovar biserrulae WSM1271]